MNKNKLAELEKELEKLKSVQLIVLEPFEGTLTGHDHSPKKVAPAVPPKPIKKNIPQVPQSSVVKQLSEPNYSKRLQNDNNSGTRATGISGTVSPIRISTSSGNTTSSHHLYSNMKMTLDNPAILEQQLEALEHHKKQLEKRGILPGTGIKQSSSSSSPQSVSPIGAPPPPPPPPASSSSSSSLSSSGGRNNSHLYSNIKNSKNDKDSEIIYSNIIHLSKTSTSSRVGAPCVDELVYSNVGFGDTTTTPTTTTTTLTSSATVSADELPPPPPVENIPPPPLTLVDNSSFDYLNQTSEDELPPPPSPVSSSYSELRRATDNFPQMPSYPLQSYQTAGTGQCGHSQIGGHTNGTNSQQMYMNTSYQNDYSTYGLSSQGSSTYESIYEPINPRPPSQLSSRSNYSLYTSYVNGPQNSGGTGTPGVVSSVTNGAPTNGSKLTNHKEAEVEVLTNLLVHSMNSGSGDMDSYGICVKCGERVVGENSGCTAMEQIYHITCFTCSQCQINLQGKPFYALDGKPYCEEDYLNTLEKCSVCMKPILERILRATGKPYHPQCFCCIVCGNSLDGIPFTVDATNQNYCIEDFHKKFAPRCCVCRQPIMPEPGQEETVRVVALDRSFHFECYKCEDCGLLLSSEAEGRGCYPLDDHVLCKSCNAKRVQALTSCMTTEL